MRTYTNKNKFFGEQIDTLLKDKLKKKQKDQKEIYVI